MTDIDSLIAANQIKRSKPYLTPQDAESLNRMTEQLIEQVMNKYAAKKPVPADDYGSREVDDETAWKVYRTAEADEGDDDYESE